MLDLECFRYFFVNFNVQLMDKASDVQLKNKTKSDKRKT